MKHKLRMFMQRLLFVVFMLCFSQGIVAQTIKQQGTVQDQSGEPLVGVTITVSGAKTNAISDVNGNFSIDCPANSTLEFSFMGFKTVRQKASGKKMSVTMQEDSHGLD